MTRMMRIENFLVGVRRIQYGHGRTVMKELLFALFGLVVLGALFLLQVRLMKRPNSNTEILIDLLNKINGPRERPASPNPVPESSSSATIPGKNRVQTMGASGPVPPLPCPCLSALGPHSQAGTCAAQDFISTADSHNREDWELKLNPGQAIV